MAGPGSPWDDLEAEIASPGAPVATPEAAPPVAGSPWDELERDISAGGVEPSPEEISAASMESRLGREEKTAASYSKMLEREAGRSVASGAFPVIPEVESALAKGYRTYPEGMPDEVAEHFQQKEAEETTSSVFGAEVPNWFRTLLETQLYLSPVLAASDYSEGKTGVKTAILEAGPWRTVSRTVRGVLGGDSGVVETNPVTKVGQAASTLQRPAAALARAITDNALAARGEVDPATGQPMKHRTNTEIVNEVLDSLDPFPNTRRADVSYVDVAANLSKLAGGTGEELPVYVGGLAGDILLDPATYLTFGGSAVSKAGSQAQRLLFRAFSSQGGKAGQLALERSQKVAQFFQHALAQTDLSRSSKLQILGQMADDTAKIGTPDALVAAQKMRDLGTGWGTYGLRVQLPLAGAPAAAEDLAKGLASLADTVSSKGMPRLQKFAESPSRLPGRKTLERLGRGKELVGGERFAFAKADLRRAVAAGAGEAVVKVDALAAAHPALANVGKGSPGKRVSRELLQLAAWANDLFNPEVRPWGTDAERLVLQMAEQQQDVSAVNLTRTVEKMNRLRTGGRITVPEQEMITDALNAPAAVAYERFQKGAKPLWDFKRVPQATAEENLQMARLAEWAYIKGVNLAFTDRLPAKYAGDAGAWYREVGLGEVIGGLSGEQQAVMRPAIEQLVAEVSQHMPADVAAVGRKWTALDTRLTPIAEHFTRAFGDLVAKERALGMEPEEIPAYVPLLVRNKAAIWKKIGLDVRPLTEGPSAAHRAIRSLEEAGDRGLDPVRDIFRLYGAAKHAHEIRVRKHIFEGNIARQFGREITDPTILARVAQTGRAASPNVLEHAGKFYDVDPDVGEGVAKVAALWEPEKISDIMRGWGAITNWWKGRATVGRLGFHARNAWSNMWNMYAGGWSGRQFGRAIEVSLVGLADNAEIDRMARAARDAGRVSKGGKPQQFVDRQVDRMREWLVERARRAADKQVVGENGRVWSYRDLYQQAQQHGVTDKGWIGADIDDSEISKIGQHPGYSTARGVLRAANPLGNQFVALRIGGATGKGIENHARMTLFLDRVLGEAGEGPLAAAEHVKKYLFDYKKLTTIEKKIKRAGVPFYTWIRKNLPLQMEQAFKRPGRMSLPFKVKRATDKRYDDLEGQIMDEELPTWIRNAYGMRVPGQMLPGMEDIGSTLVWMPDFPYRDLNTLSLDDGEGLLGNLTPLLKLPVEVATGETLTRKRKLSMVEVPNGLETIMGTIVPWGKIIEGTESVTGRTVKYVDERALYVLQTMLPDIFTWQRLFLPKPKDPVEAEKVAGRRWADTTGVGRFVPVRPDQERGQRRREMAERIRQFTPRGAEGFKK